MPRLLDRPVVLASAAFVLQLVLLVIGTTLANSNPLSTSSYARWDSSNYISIAQRGYYIGYCGPTHDTIPIEGELRPGGVNVYCGNAAWFPGYSYLIRGASMLGMNPYRAGVVWAWTLRWLGLYVIAVWIRRCAASPETTAQTMIAAAAFPGNIYYVTVFPMALTVLMLWLCIDAVRRASAWQTGAAAFLTAFSYSSAWLGPAAVSVCLALIALRERRWRTLNLAAAAGISALAAVLTVFAIQYAQTGLWDAFLLNQATFENVFGMRYPVENYAERFVTVVTESRPLDTADAWEAIVVLAWVLASAAVVIRRARDADRNLWLCLAVGFAFWFFPELIPSANYSGQVRSESLLMPLLVIFPLLPRLLRWLLPVAFLILTPWVDALFFLAKII